jgi:hypothetical protein
MRALIFGITVLAAVTFWETAAQGDLVHQWTFNNVNDGFGGGRDYVGNAHGSFFGDVGFENGQLVLTGAGRMATDYTNQTIGESTLVAWVTNVGTTAGGGVISIANGAPEETFNGIVYGERTPNQWMNGSNGWSRTLVNNGGALENSTEQIMMAITYSAGGQITLYRNGEFYANGGTFALQSFVDPRFHIGARHVNPSAGTPPGNGWYRGLIDEARVYNSALSASEIQALYVEGPVPIPEPSTIAALAILGTIAMVRRSRRN